MNFHVVTLFPEALEAAARSIGVVGQAIQRGDLGLTCVTPRAFTTNVHHTVDDRPFGGGDGMIMMAEPLAQSVRQIRASIDAREEASGPPKKIRVIHVSPRGRVLDDRLARELATYTDLVLVSSRYGGADQRFLNSEVDEEISIGDYILTGGELAALVLIDAIGRLQGGVLGNDSSATNETFAGTNGLLEHPQFTRPREWAGQEVPAVYMSGDHAKIAAYQEGLGFLLTAAFRPDLLKRSRDAGTLSPKKISVILKQLASMTDAELVQVGLLRAGEGVALADESALQLRQKLEAELRG